VAYRLPLGGCVGYARIPRAGIARLVLPDITGGDANYKALYTTTPAWKDVVLVPKGGRVDLLVPVMDYSGMIMFHCHILEHEDIGMMGMGEIMEPDMPM
jgi:hypothetical protein